MPSETVLISWSAGVLSTYLRLPLLVGSVLRYEDTQLLYAVSISGLDTSGTCWAGCTYSHSNDPSYALTVLAARVSGCSIQVRWHPVVVPIDGLVICPCSCKASISAEGTAGCPASSKIGGIPWSMSQLLCIMGTVSMRYHRPSTHNLTIYSVILRRQLAAGPIRAICNTRAHLTGLFEVRGFWRVVNGNPSLSGEVCTFIACMSSEDLQCGWQTRSQLQ